MAPVAMLLVVFAASVIGANALEDFSRPLGVSSSINDLLQGLEVVQHPNLHLEVLPKLGASIDLHEIVIDRIEIKNVESGLDVLSNPGGGAGTVTIDGLGARLRGTVGIKLATGSYLRTFYADIRDTKIMLSLQLLQGPLVDVPRQEPRRFISGVSATRCDIKAQVTGIFVHLSKNLEYLMGENLTGKFRSAFGSMLSTLFSDTGGYGHRVLGQGCKAIKQGMADLTPQLAAFNEGLLNAYASRKPSLRSFSGYLPLEDVKPLAWAARTTNDLGNHSVGDMIGALIPLPFIQEMLRKPRPETREVGDIPQPIYNDDKPYVVYDPQNPPPAPSLPAPMSQLTTTITNFSIEGLDELQEFMIPEISGIPVSQSSWDLPPLDAVGMRVRLGVKHLAVSGIAQVQLDRIDGQHLETDFTFATRLDDVKIALDFAVWVDKKKWSRIAKTTSLESAPACFWDSIESDAVKLEDFHITFTPSVEHPLRVQPVDKAHANVDLYQLANTFFEVVAPASPHLMQDLVMANVKPEVLKQVSAQVSLFIQENKEQFVASSCQEQVEAFEYESGEANSALQPIMLLVGGVIALAAMLMVSGPQSALASRNLDGPHPLVMEPCIPLRHRFAVPLFLVANAGLFIYAHNTNYSVLELTLSRKDGSLADSITLPPLKYCTIFDTLRELKRMEAWMIFVCILMVSGIFPYVRLSGLLCCWFTPSFKMRGSLLRAMDFLGKWQLMESWVMITVMVAFHITVHFPTSQAVVTTTPTRGFYVFMVASLMSMLLGRIVLGWHETSRKRCTENVQMVRWVWDSGKTATKEQQEDTGVKSSVTVLVATLGKMGQSDMVRPVLQVLLLVGVALTGLGIFLPLIKIKYSGLGAYVMRASAVAAGADPETATRTALSLWDIMSSLPNDVRNPGIGIYAIQGILFVLVFVLVIVYAVCVIVAAVVPMRSAAQRSMLHLVYMVHSWCSLDVFVISTCCALLELDGILRHEIGDKCNDVNDLIASSAWRDRMEPTCFRLQVLMGAGAWILVIIALLSFVMGLVVVHGLQKEIERERVEECEWQEAGAVPLSGTAGTGSNIELNNVPGGEGPTLHRMATPFNPVAAGPVMYRMETPFNSGRVAEVPTEHRIGTVSHDSHS